MSDREKSACIDDAATHRQTEAQAVVNAVAAMGEGVLLMNPDGTILTVNKTIETMTGLPQNTFAGQNLRAIIPKFVTKEDARLLMQALDTIAQGHTPKLNPIVLQRDSDQPLTVIPSCSWVCDPDAAQDRLVLALKDITERVRTRQSKEEFEHKYRELVENANSSIIRITPEHRILYFNEFAQSFFGYGAEEIVGKSVLGTIVPLVDSNGRDMRAMTQAITEHPELYTSNENENICKDGRRVWIHWTNRALRDDRGAVREILCVGTDMTQQRKLAREANTYRRRLQQLADRLTETEAQERRNVAIQIHDTVVQTLSLSSIRLAGVISALEQAGLTKERNTIAGVRDLIHQGTKECRGLMEELVPSLLYEVGLIVALRGFAEKQQELCDAWISVEGNADPVFLPDTLRTLLFQCARELMMNAIKYAGGCQISVVVSVADEKVILQVQDNGCGFDPDSLDREDYDYSDGGFGLFNIRERVESIGGGINIASAPGKGTSITIHVPMPTDH